MRLHPTACGLLLTSLPLVGDPPTGAISRHVWTNIGGGTAVSNLTSIAAYPDSPNLATIAAPFVAPTNWADSYGTRMFGWVHAPVSGNYTFYIHSDDNSELWLSTTPSPDDRVLIANVPQWTEAQEYGKFASQVSGPVALEAGKYYYIEALQKEGGGGDNLGVAWTYPGQASPVYIPGNRLSTWQNLVPELQDDAATVRPGGTVALNILANDLDPNGAADFDLSSLMVSTAPASGTTTLDPATGRLFYTHTGTGTDTDTLQYQISDEAGLAASAVVTITISDDMRLPLATSQMPATPPAEEISLIDAFPGVTFSEPIDMATPPGETNRLFVLEKGGDIELIPDLIAPTRVQFLNLDFLVNARANEVFRSDGEQGLLGLAFHPDYVANGRFFVSYSLTIGGVRYLRLSEFAVSPTNPNLADSGSEKIFIQMQNEASNHNGGDLHFGPDGYLYMSWGDEGGGNDEFNNSQRIDGDFWSGITRIDVDLEAEDYTGTDGSGGDDGNLPPNSHPAIVADGSGNPRYEIPADNPWIGATSFNSATVNPSEVRTEFWAVGFRNPWRMSFDPETGELWVGDVGQGAREEINLVVKGGNYEWAFREGDIAGPKWSQRPPGWAGGEGPVYDYQHGGGEFEGASVTGGIVYRGDRIAALTGQYLFADFVSGNVWALDNSGATPDVRRLAGEGDLVGFGSDPSNGDALVADLGNGIIRRMVVETPTNSFPQTLAATGLFADLGTLEPNPGLIGYDVNLPFWSDHALKTRWFGHPETEPTLGFSEDGNWTLPPGAIWVKHFDIELERGNPATKKRLETRVIVSTADNVYGVSYRWNEEETEAHLVGTAGEEFDLPIIEDGMPITQRWHIPSRAGCITCHSEQAGGTLSFRTRQLNRDGEIAGTPGNFISLLGLAGYLEGLQDDPRVMARHVTPSETGYSLEARARSWLAVNCAYCHSSGGSVPAEWDASAHLKLFETGLINGMVESGVLDPADRLIVPGSDLHSVIVNRAAARNGYSRMPPLATSEIDEEGVQLLIDWINSELPGRESYADWRERLFGNSPDGAPGIDADGDGRDNESEFLSMTDPLVVDSAPAPSFVQSEEGFELSFSPLAGRGQVLESSPDLENWMRWPVEGNDGLLRPTGTDREFAISPLDSQLFFRIRVEER